MHLRSLIPTTMLAVVAMTLAVATPVHAAGKTPAERKAVLHVIDQTFAAMAAHDAAAMRALLVPGTVFSVRKPDGTIKMESDEDFLHALATGKGEWRERIWSPQVLIDHGLAQVWAPYDFHLDGKFSHCGIDSFALVQDAGGQWRISAIAYNVQVEGCPTGPKPGPKATVSRPAMH